MKNHRFHLPGAPDQGRIASKKLGNGLDMPMIGFGTFSARLSGEETAGAVETALGYGYRMLDCAAMYNNERFIGPVLSEAQAAGIPREELFVLGKLPNTMHGNRVGAACRKSLSDLKLDYLDAYLVHWPVPNALSPEAASGVYLESSRPYIHEEFMQTWQGMERLVREGLVCSIGVSNVTVNKLSLLLRDADIAPAINEMELHPTFQQDRLFRFSLQNGVLPVAYSPLGAPKRPERNIMPGDLVDTEDKTVLRIARDRGVTPAAVCLKWAAQRGQVPVPFASRPENILGNLLAVLEGPLSDEEMTLMAGIDAGCRLSRGQGYLWPGADSWQALWEDNELISS